MNIMYSIAALLLLFGIIMCLLARYWYILSYNLTKYSLSRPHKKKTYQLSKILYIKYLHFLSLGICMLVTSIWGFFDVTYVLIGYLYSFWLIYKSTDTYVQYTKIR